MQSNIKRSATHSTAAYSSRPNNGSSRPQQGVRGRGFQLPLERCDQPACHAAGCRIWGRPQVGLHARVGMCSYPVGHGALSTPGVPRAPTSPAAKVCGLHHSLLDACSDLRMQQASTAWQINASTHVRRRQQRTRLYDPADTQGLMRAYTLAARSSGAGACRGAARLHGPPIKRVRATSKVLQQSGLGPACASRRSLESCPKHPNRSFHMRTCMRAMNVRSERLAAPTAGRRRRGAAAGGGRARGAWPRRVT
mgnify:CR=1 FL=1